MLKYDSRIMEWINSDTGKVEDLVNDCECKKQESIFMTCYKRGVARNQRLNRKAKVSEICKHARLVEKRFKELYG